MSALGIYHATTCHDAAGMEREGEEFVGFNRLSSASGAVAEVQFADGTWKLCDPDADVLPYFMLDTYPDRVFRALRYGQPWNGWATPVVDRWTLQALLDMTGEPHRWEGRKVWCDGTAAEPDAAGAYDLGGWGWTFITTTHWL